MQDKNDQTNRQDKKSLDERLEEAEKKHGGPLGRGMTSPDSTQVPLSAETGEPDERAIRGDWKEGEEEED